MNIRDLEYFVKLTEVKHFSKVAKEFHVSQPTITFAVKRLEKELGCQLMARHHTSTLAMTDAGKQFLDHAKAILTHCHLAKVEIQKMQEQRLVVGLPPLIENNYFVPIAKLLKDEQFLNQITTTEEGSATTLEMLKNGDVDIALLGTIDPPADDDIVFETFDQQPFSIYVAKQNPLAKLKSVSFNELATADFVQFKKGFVHNHAFELLERQNNVRPNVVFRSDEMPTIVSLIADNIGIGFFTPLVQIDHDNIVQIPLNDRDAPMFNVSLAYRNSHYFDEWQQRVFDSVKAGLMNH